MQLVKFEGAFFDENIETEEVTQVVSNLLDKIERKGVIEMSFRRCQIHDTFAMRLGDALESLNMLQILDLSDTLIREAVKCVADGLIKGRVRLTHLYLNDSQIQTPGALELAKYLNSVDSLVVVNVSRNEIEEEGSKEICESLTRSAKSGNLKRFDSGENHLDSVDAQSAFV